MRAPWLWLVAGCWHEVPPPREPVVYENPAPRVAPRPRAREPYRDVSGTWKGIGYQYDTRTQWDLEMTLLPRGKVGDVIGTISYESGNCTADLIRQPERDGGETLVMTERLVTGQGRCVDNGTIRIPRRPLGNELDWRWDFAAGNEGAKSTVRRD